MDCRVGGRAPVWSVPLALATSNDLQFVSEDCTRAAFLYPAPEKQGTWAKTVIIRIVERGAVAREVVAGQLPGFSEANASAGCAACWARRGSGRTIPTTAPRCCCSC